MTKKLYDDDPYLKECTSLVVQCEKVKDGYAVALDQTCFYPQGGGQPSDRGAIDGHEVLEVYEEGGKVYHLLAQEVEVGKTVNAVLDFAFRKDAMEQHLGQHIFSCIGESHFHATTVAARIEPGVSHVEFNRVLTSEQLLELEKYVNQAIRADIPVLVHNYTREQGAEMGLSPGYLAHDKVRIVEIVGMEKNPCGGTHPRSTAEVNSCVITGTKEVRGAFRIYYKFGNRAMADRAECFNLLQDVQQVLDIFDKTELPKKVKELVATAAKNRGEITALREQLVATSVKLLLANSTQINGTTYINWCFDGCDCVKEIVDTLVLEHKAAVAVTNKNGGTFSLIIAEPKGVTLLNAGGIVKEFLAKHGGRGGGGATLAQCSTEYNEEVSSTAAQLLDIAVGLA